MKAHDPQPRDSRRPARCHRATSLPNSPEATHHAWSADVIVHCADIGREFGILVVINDDTDECLDLHMDKAIGTEAIIDVLDRLVAERGAPSQIRCDGGPECCGPEIQTWLAGKGIGTLHVKPGSPPYRTRIEASSAKLLQDVFGRTPSGGLRQIRAKLEQWRIEHNKRQADRAREHGKG